MKTAEMKIEVTDGRVVNVEVMPNGCCVLTVELATASTEDDTLHHQEEMDIGELLEELLREDNDNSNFNYNYNTWGNQTKGTLYWGFFLWFNKWKTKCQFKRKLVDFGIRKTHLKFNNKSGFLVCARLNSTFL